MCGGDGEKHSNELIRAEEEADVESGGEEDGVEEGGVAGDKEMSEGSERELTGSEESEESSGGEQGKEDAAAVGSKRGRTARGQPAEGSRDETTEVDSARRAQEPSTEDWLAAAPQMVEGLVPCMGCAVPLRLSAGGVTGLTCDGGCGRKLRAVDRRLSCGECDLDVCVGCAGKQAGAGTRPEGLKRLLGSNPSAWAGYVWVGGWWVRGLVTDGAACQRRCRAGHLPLAEARGSHRRAAPLMRCRARLCGASHAWAELGTTGDHWGPLGMLGGC